MRYKFGKIAINAQADVIFELINRFHYTNLEHCLKGMSHAGGDEVEEFHIGNLFQQF